MYLGGPGSGKGTQCEEIVKKFGYCHLSTGICHNQWENIPKLLCEFTTHTHIFKRLFCTEMSDLKAGLKISDIQI